jgi:transposase
MKPLFDTLTLIALQIRDYEKRIESICENEFPATKLVRQVGGIGPITALAFVLILEDPLRFRSSRSVAAYLGLTPKKRESSSQNPELRISKSGDGYLRRLLVLAAQHVLGPFGKDCDLRRHGLELAAKGAKNAKKRAVVAIARKLAVLLHRLWVTGQVYEPLRCSAPAA